MQFGVVVASASMWRTLILILLVTPVVMLPACTNPGIEYEPPVKGSTSPMMVALSLDELTSRADLILIGTVASKESRGDTRKGSIYTLATVTVERLLKGQPGLATVTVRVPGGKVDGITQKVEDTPEFLPGEKVLVFLAQGEGSAMLVVGGLQGKCVIENGKIISVVPSINGLLTEDIIASINAKLNKSTK